VPLAGLSHGGHLQSSCLVRISPVWGIQMTTSVVASSTHSIAKRPLLNSNSPFNGAQVWPLIFLREPQSGWIFPRKAGRRC